MGFLRVRFLLMGICAVCALIGLAQPAFASSDEAHLALRHYMRAVLAQNKQDTDTAIKEYLAASVIDPTSSVICYNLGVNFIKKNDTAQATEYLKRAVDLAPDAVEPHAVLALVYSFQTKLELAAAEYELALKSALRNKPDDPEVLKNLGLLFLQQNKLDQAERMYHRVTELASSDSEAFFYLASVYDLQNKNSGVEDALRKSIALNPEYPDALNYLGYLFVERNKNLGEAEQLIRKALALDPDNGAYVDSLGWWYYKKGKFQDALNQLKTASVLLDDPVIWDHLGDAYYKVGDYKSAKCSWEKSLNLDANQDKVKSKLKSVKQQLVLDPGQTDAQCHSSKDQNTSATGVK